MNFVVLGLGSNRSWNGMSPLRLLAEAASDLRLLFDHGFSVSSVYVSKPMYYEEQDDFHNMAVCGFSELSAHELLSKIHEIEAGLGRNRSSEIRNGPRSIDIDIELFGKEEIHFTDPVDSMKNLEVPHPRLSERSFVLIPLLEIFPQDADALKVDLFAAYLSKIGSQGLKKLLDRNDFEKLLANRE